MMNEKTWGHRGCDLAREKHIVKIKKQKNGAI